MSNNNGNTTHAACIGCGNKNDVLSDLQLCSQCEFHVPEPQGDSRESGHIWREAVAGPKTVYVPPNKKGDVLMIPGRLPYVYK